MPFPKAVGSYSVSNRLDSQQFDIGKKTIHPQKFNSMVKPRDVEVEDLPSDLSNDEWGEIQRYGQKLHENAIKLHK